jgi:PGF-pre-PGF domain-containing protein
VNTEPEGISTTIEAITASPDQYNGKVVTFEGSDIGVNVSVKSILGSLGISVPVDITLHGSVIWSRPIPSSINEIPSKTLLSIGASSIHQDKAITYVNGASQVYRYIGKIISASTMQGSLSGSLFIMYKREKIQTLPAQEISTIVQQKIQDTVTNLKYLFQRQTPDIVTIPSISQETPGFIQVNKENIENITLHMKNQASNVSIAVLKFDSKPAEVTTNVTGEVYSYLEITAQNIVDSDVDNVAITFKIAKSWISSNNIDVNSVKIQRYNDGTWSILTTNKLNEDASDLYFSANSPGFSIYAITASKEQAPTTSVGTPGFELVFVLMALVIALYLYNKKE